LDRAGIGSLVDDDIEPVILHGGVEIFLDGWMQPVDLVDEKNVALLEIGEDAGQVAGLFDLRPARAVNFRAGGRRDDVGEGGFPQPRRAGEEDMFEDIGSLHGRGQSHHHHILDFRLANKFAENRRTQ
jgi:hypothetical protein